MAGFYPNVPAEELQNEIWKQLPKPLDAYAVSSLGRVKRFLPGAATQPGRICKFKQIMPGSRGRVYPMVTLSNKGKMTDHTVHALVALAFIGLRPAGLQVNHKDGNKLNNRADNLEYVTPQQNIEHAHSVLNRIVPTRASGKRNGAYTKPHRVRRGTENGQSKLTELDILTIRQLRAEGYTLQWIADRFGITDVTVSYIANRKTWKHL